VEDLPEWNRRISSVLRSVPELQIVGEASDGLEAVQKAAELKPDLILLDIGLPSINGLEVASRVSAQDGCTSKILFVSENRDADVIAKALSYPRAFGYLLKSDVHNDLLAAVAAALRGETFTSPGAQRAVTA
jgi:DNA-binding NarL/FixJ family response regulator